jgi:hypothetical protein
MAPAVAPARPRGSPAPVTSVLYRGVLYDGFPRVLRIEVPSGVEELLPLRLDLRNHSPSGFAWGYRGSGPAQLALALLADALGDDGRAERLHQHFKDAFVARLVENREWQASVQGVRLLADVVETRLERRDG